jgi:large subunit ribosomal protein L10
MNREQKSATIEEIAAQIEAAEAIFAVDYRGISVPQAAELRAKLREADASFRVVKNRLTKLAAEKTGEERLAELLEGPTALAFVRGDTAMAAKAISSFNKEHEVLTFKGGFMEGLTLDEDQFKAIARLPGRDVLNGQLAGVVASPLTGLVRGLGSMIQGLALQLGQIAEKGLVSGEAPAGASDGVAEDADQGSQGDGAPADGSGSEAEQPADEGVAEPADQSSDDSDAGPADAPVEEPPTESGAAAETPAEGDPSQAEGDEGDAEPAGDEAGEEPAADGDDETSETDDASKEEE